MITDSYADFYVWLTQQPKVAVREPRPDVPAQGARVQIEIHTLHDLMIAFHRDAEAEDRHVQREAAALRCRLDAMSAEDVAMAAEALRRGM